MYSLVCLVLAHHLQAVAVDVVAVQQIDVLEGAVVALEGDDRVVLDAPRLIDDGERGVGNLPCEEARPLGLGERDAVELLDLGAQVGEQSLLGVNPEAVVTLGYQDADETRLELGLELVCPVRRGMRRHLGAHRGLGTLQDEAVGRHALGAVFRDGVVDGHEETPSLSSLARMSVSRSPP